MSMKSTRFAWLIIFFLAGHTTLMAQTPKIAWQKTFGGTANEETPGLISTTDGGYIMTVSSWSDNGDITSSHGQADVWIVKLNADFSIAWQKNYGGSADDVRPIIAQTPDGGYIVGATAFSTDGDITGHHGNNETGDFWIFKINSTGAIQWQKVLGSGSHEGLSSLKITSDGGCIAAGVTYLVGGDVTEIHGQDDVWVVKLSSTGTLEWQKTHGGSGTELVLSIDQTPDGGYVIGGMSNSAEAGYNVHGADLYYDAYILKLNASGQEEWHKLLGGSSEEKCRVISQPDGSYMLVGKAMSIDGDVTGLHAPGTETSDIWVAKLSHAGNIEWQRCYGGSFMEIGTVIHPSPDGGYIIVGMSYPRYGNTLFEYDGDLAGLPSHLADDTYSAIDIWAFKISATGQILWQKIMGGSDVEYPNWWDEGGSSDIVINPDGSCILPLTTYSKDYDVTNSHFAMDQWGSITSETWLVKLSPCPSFVAVSASICQGSSYTFNGQQLTTEGVYKATLVNSTGCDSIVTLTLTLYPIEKPVIGSNGTILSAAGSYTSYQWLLDGVPVTGATEASYSYTQSGVYALIATNANNCPATSDPFTVFPNGSVAQEGAFVVPNPAKDFVTIRFPNAIPSFYISIATMEGKKLGLQSFSNTNSPRLDVRKLPAGVYLLRLFGTDGQKASFKMIKGK